MMSGVPTQKHDVTAAWSSRQEEVISTVPDAPAGTPLTFEATDGWRNAYPGATAGALLLTGVQNPASHPGLDEHRVLLEKELRARYGEYTRKQLKKLPPLDAYADFYRRFGKSYHVQLQLESLAHKERSIASPSALVQAMFMAELQNLLLTAGHDADSVVGPVRVMAAEGGERYIRLGGQEQDLKAGDMYITDADGILSSVIYGPDERTKLRPETTRALFTVYGPPGVDADSVRHHLESLTTNVRILAPGAEPLQLEVLAA